jgi:hypothetical protein
VANLIYSRYQTISQGDDPMNFDDKMKLLFAEMGMHVDPVIVTETEPETEPETKGLEVVYA